MYFATWRTGGFYDGRTGRGVTPFYYNGVVQASAVYHVAVPGLTDTRIVVDGYQLSCRGTGMVVTLTRTEASGAVTYMGVPENIAADTTYEPRNFIGDGGPTGIIAEDVGFTGDAAGGYYFAIWGQYLPTVP